MGELCGPGKEGAVEGAAGLTSRRPHLVGGVGRSRSRVSVFGTALVGHGPYEDARCLGLLCCWVGDMLASERSGEASKGVLANSSNKKWGGGVPGSFQPRLEAPLASGSWTSAPGVGVILVMTVCLSHCYTHEWGLWGGGGDSGLDRCPSGPDVKFLSNKHHF